MAGLSDGPSQASSSAGHTEGLQQASGHLLDPTGDGGHRSRGQAASLSRTRCHSPRRRRENPTHSSARVRPSRTRIALAPGDTLHRCRRGLRPAQLRSSPKGPLSNGHHPPLQRLDGRPAPPAGLGARGGVSRGPGHRPPLSPREGWLSDGRQVLHFRPSRWDRWSQQLEFTVGELLPDQPVPLLKRRLELSREEAIKLWTEKKQQHWQITAPQWHPPQRAGTGRDQAGRGVPHCRCHSGRVA